MNKCVLCSLLSQSSGGLSHIISIFQIKDKKESKINELSIDDDKLWEWVGGVSLEAH